jgi:hypothetical protein
VSDSPAAQLVREFLKAARAGGTSVFLVYGYNADGKINLASASNVDENAVGQLKTWMLGLDVKNLIEASLAAAERLHNDGSCPVCTAGKPWDELHDTQKAHHIQIAATIIEVIRERASAPKRAMPLVTV